MNLKKRLVVLLAAGAAATAIFSVPAHADLIKSYQDLLCGNWYLWGRGIEVCIEPYDSNFVKMTADGLITAHEEAYEKDSVEHDRIYYLTEDSSDPQRWLSDDGRISITQYTYDAANFWLKVEDQEEEYFYSGAKCGAVSLEFEKAPDEGFYEGEAVDNDYEGVWKSVDTDKIITIKVIPSSGDVYSIYDYVLNIEQERQEGENVFLERRVLRGSKNGKKLEMGVQPWDASYYKLESYHTLCEYDDNDMLLETFEKEGVMRPGV